MYATEVIALFHNPLIEIEFETRQEKEAFINRFCFFGIKCAIRRAKMPESNSGKTKTVQMLQNQSVQIFQTKNERK